MNSPLVSVVMVVRDVERFLGEAIESILCQTFRDFEFIIVDFGSTDKSRSILSTYAVKDCRIKVHVIPNCALAQARNSGCSLAQGRYIAIMDADDIAVPERLAWQVEFMGNHPDVGVLGGATEWIDATGRLLRIDRPPVEDPEIRAALKGRCPFATPTIRTEAFGLVGGYRRVFVQAEDYDLWLRIAERFQCANLPQVVLKYRIHSGQLSVRRTREQTLCVLAAQVSALARGEGMPDPLDGVDAVTPELLAALGVSDATQQITTAGQCLSWLRTMYLAGEYSSALATTDEVLESSGWEHAERWQMADIRLIAARSYWKQRRFARSLLMACQAFMTRPAMAGRPIKTLLRRTQDNHSCVLL